MKTDAEILWSNVKRICKTKGTKVSYVEEKVGYGRGHLRHMAARDGHVHIDHIRYYSQALKVKPEKLMEGMFDDN